MASVAKTQANSTTLILNIIIVELILHKKYTNRIFNSSVNASAESGSVSIALALIL